MSAVTGPLVGSCLSVDVGLTLHVPVRCCCHAPLILSPGSTVVSELVCTWLEQAGASTFIGAGMGYYPPDRVITSEGRYPDYSKTVLLVSDPVVSTSASNLPVSPTGSGL